MAKTGGKLGILVGGGPAPGINGVIEAATREAIKNGLEVIGIYDGFKWLCKGDVSHTQKLTVADVNRIHFGGGSILRTARDNPTRSPEMMARVGRALEELGLSYLVTIGGDDTAFAASRVAEHTGTGLRVAHVPKTIDNDIPLPGNMPTFGFQTARDTGVELVHNLMEDARTTSRWYFVVTMGRKAGHLTLGMGKASGATVSIIAEEFPEGTIPLDDVCAVLEGAMIKRRMLGREDGVALIAEGIGERLDKQELAGIPGVEVEYDDHGHIELREIPLARVLKRRVGEWFEEKGKKVTIVDVNLGYELRCAPPIPFDCEYVLDLGWGAVDYVLSDAYEGGAVVCLEGGRIQAILFDQMLDPDTGRMPVRLVEVNTVSYRVAREYMVRLEAEDFLEADRVEKLAEAAQMDAGAFRERFARVAK